jgi:NAD(P)-dependent dehydrogenase (short-subunit alcohol dehydrogenase family)
LHDQVACVIGGTGGLGWPIAEALSDAGAAVAIVGRTPDRVATAAARLAERQGKALGIVADVCDPASLADAHRQIRAQLGRCTILIHAAGGNHPAATTSQDRTFFELVPVTLEQVVRLNLLSTLWSCQLFGRDMVEVGYGTIVTIASVAGVRPLSRVVAYSAAKAGVINFTQWLAVYLAREFSPSIRVNALVPGFFLTEQNRFLLTDPHSSDRLSERGRQVLARTPQGRFGNPQDLIREPISYLPMIEISRVKHQEMHQSFFVRT